MTEVNVAYNKGEVYKKITLFKKEKTRIHVILHPINTIKEKKKQ